MDSPQLISNPPLLEKNASSSIFYQRLKIKRNDSKELVDCIERIVNQLAQETTTSDRPGMLLGKIQSGKTRGFVGVIARSFDRGFDIALVITKATKPLSEQTVKRFANDFCEFIDEDLLLVIDIMKHQGKLIRSELKRKIVLIAKKEVNNLERVIDFIKDNVLQDKRILIVDDEADLASIRFTKTTDKTDIEQGAIAEKIDALRRMINQIAYLQVTATPYSLYLQPESYNSENKGYVFKPKKPAFTELLPIHSGYVGGDDYFGAFDENDSRAYLYVEVDQQEQDTLRKQDHDLISEQTILENTYIIGLRLAILTFILAACVRSWQLLQKGEGEKRKYVMVIHNDVQKKSHAWQTQIVGWIVNSFIKLAELEPDKLRPMLHQTYNNLKISVTADKGLMPPFDLIFSTFINLLKEEEIAPQKVNSDTDLIPLLDQNGELKLRAACNIFVGGSILDRGITIPNLIAFYYGRNPKKMQADTVLQHSRMYGNRDRRDLAVTRFYTTLDVYNRLFTINEFENALRDAFETKAHDRGVVFIQADNTGGVRPCAPNKLLMSNVVAVRPNGFYLPTGFDIKNGSEALKTLKSLDDLILPLSHDKGEFVEASKEFALNILKKIEKCFAFNNNKDFEWRAMYAMLDYYVENTDKVLLLIETARKIDRKKSGDKSGLSILGTTTRNKMSVQSRLIPSLVLLRQEGSLELNWSGCNFWWPILAIPSTVEPCVFALKIAN